MLMTSCAPDFDLWYIRLPDGTLWEQQPAPGLYGYPTERRVAATTPTMEWEQMDEREEAGFGPDVLGEMMSLPVLPSALEAACNDRLFAEREDDGELDPKVLRARRAGRDLEPTVRGLLRLAMEEAGEGEVEFTITMGDPADLDLPGGAGLPRLEAQTADHTYRPHDWGEIGWRDMPARRHPPGTPPDKGSRSVEAARMTPS